jgi:putative SOS response-associated peptidase YedK
MPVILENADWSTWLDVDGTSVEAATELLQPAAEDVLTFHPVSTDVNRVSMNDVHLIHPIEIDLKNQDGQMRLL